MTHSRTATLLAALAWSAAVSTTNADSIARFVSDDFLPCSMESLTPNLVVLKSPHLESPTPFHVASLVDLTLAGILPETKSDHEAAIVLTNGDTARGQLISVTNDTVQLETAYAGRMAFRKLNVKDLSIQAVTDAVYRGPTGMEGWKTSGSKPSWEFVNASFQSLGQGTIGKEDILPDECSSAFDVAWKGEPFGFKMIVFSKDVTRSTGASGYEIIFQRGGYFIRNCKTSGFVGDGQAQEFLENEKVRVQVQASRKTGKICIWINNRVSGVWEDPEFKKGAFGGGIQWTSMSGAPLRISRINITQWDGATTQPPEAQAGMGMGGFGMGMARLRGMGLGGIQPGDGQPKAKKSSDREGRLELANGDSILGEPTSIDNGRVAIQSPLGEIKLPIARLRSINLKQENLETAIRRKGDARIWFPDGSSLVAELKEIKDGQLTGTSQNFGSATFRLDTISRIDFNIHNEKTAARHSSAGW